MANLQQNKYLLKIDHSGSYFPSDRQPTESEAPENSVQREQTETISKPFNTSTRNINQTSGYITGINSDQQNELQRQLNQNVANMEKIIKKFKQLSKNIAKEDITHSKYFSQTSPYIL